eukprot:31299-Pelagococcus_subviridis.AAC.5
MSSPPPWNPPCDPPEENPPPIPPPSLYELGKKCGAADVIDDPPNPPEPPARQLPAPCDPPPRGMLRPPPRISFWYARSPSLIAAASPPSRWRRAPPVAPLPRWTIMSRATSSSVMTSSP